MELIVTIIIAVIGSSGISSIIVACLTRKWKKEDEAKAQDTKDDERISALVNAQKVTMVYEVKSAGKQYITAGEITIDDKDTLREMYKAYKGLGGNGHLDTIMNEVDRLKVVGE